MKNLFIIVFLIILSATLCGQDAAMIVNHSLEYTYQKASLRNTPLFNAEEIKANRIRSCMIIHPWTYWDKYQKIIDTLYIFDFDETGNIKREIRFRSWDKAVKDTLYPPISERIYYARIDTTVEKQNGQTIVTKYYVWAFNYETEIEDTSYIKTLIYDDKNRLIEFEMHGTEDFFKISFCGTGITFHRKYQYDDKNRIIYYEDLHGHHRAFFEHRKNQCRIRVYDTKTNELVGKPVIHFKITNEAIIENDGHFTVKFTRLYKDSNLFSHFFDKQNGSDRSDEYFFIYDYFERPGSDSKNPILTKT